MDWSTAMIRTRRTSCAHPRRWLSAFALAAVLVGGAAGAAGVEMSVQVPFDWSSGAFDLDKLETMNAEPFYSRRFDVPYAALEPTLRQRIGAKMPVIPPGVGDCA